MTIEIFKQNRDETLNRALTLWLRRTAALALFALGLLYWVRLVGIFDGALWRFDLMPVPWKMAAPMLAVLYPIAGVGLWLTVSWGTVVWVIVALTEAAMAFALPSAFGGDLKVVTGHAIGLSLLSLLSLLRVVAWVEKRRRRNKV